MSEAVCGMGTNQNLDSASFTPGLLGNASR